MGIKGGMTMLTDLKLISIVIGCVAGLFLFATLVWSIAFPERRVWPLKKATAGIKIRVWAATIAIFAAAFVLGVTDWNSLEWPAPIRWSVGLTLIIVGNIAVWRGVIKIGFDATSGEVDIIKTAGLYVWSRNPQYVVDMAIILGWAVLSASIWSISVAALGIVVLGIAPLAEEPWLEENYGQQYPDYRNRVRRYF